MRRAQQGSKAGLAEANKRATDDNNRKDIAHTAGEMLMNVRHYPLAADFLEAGASGDNAAQAMGLASCCATRSIMKISSSTTRRRTW